jgi:hypothetical protein
MTNFLDEDFSYFREVEKDWKRTRLKPSPKELIEIFPNAGSSIREKIC